MRRKALGQGGPSGDSPSFLSQTSSYASRASFSVSQRHSAGNVTRSYERIHSDSDRSSSGPTRDVPARHSASTRANPLEACRPYASEDSLKAALFTKYLCSKSYATLASSSTGSKEDGGQGRETEEVKVEDAAGKTGCEKRAPRVRGEGVQQPLSKGALTNGLPVELPVRRGTDSDEDPGDEAGRERGLVAGILHPLNCENE